MTEDLTLVLDNIKEVKRQLDKAKSDKAELDGRIAEQMAQLKSLDVNSVAAAKDEITRLNREMDKLEKNIFKWYDELERIYVDS